MLDYIVIQNANMFGVDLKLITFNMVQTEKY